jgi:demethylmenaquinone methyltransferase/2-methoxy-6-polyprenyl-1,4-benzoquinol methylase
MKLIRLKNSVSATLMSNVPLLSKRFIHSYRVRESKDIPWTHPINRLNQKKYNITAWFYDILDFPWELQYRKWRPAFTGNLRGEVLEAGIGTGRNLKYYHNDVNLTALDLNTFMLKRAMKRARDVRCRVTFVQEDVCHMESVPSGHFDWVLAAFLCCVVPEELQHQVVRQVARVLKPGGRFRLLEMIYSKNTALRRRQNFFTPFVEKVYGARFDRNTLKHIEEEDRLKITSTRFLKHDTYLMIEGVRKD